MSSINYATFSGTITRNSIRQGVSSNGKAWANFSISSSSSTYDKNTGAYKKEPPFYCECVAFGNLATVIKPVLQEGVSLLVSGHFSTEGYTTKEGDEGKRYRLMCENIAVICVPWQTISVHVNNNNNASASSNPAPVTPQQQSAGSSNAWNNIPMTAALPYSGATALGVSDNPSF